MSRRNAYYLFHQNAPEVDVSANFDLSGLQEDSTGDSDSDFDLDYTVVWGLDYIVVCDLDFTVVWDSDWNVVWDLDYTIA